jgi:hypothetical protein
MIDAVPTYSKNFKFESKKKAGYCDIFLDFLQSLHKKCGDEMRQQLKVGQSWILCTFGIKVQ